MGKVENRIIFQAGFKTTKTVGKFYGQARAKSVRVGTWHNSNYYYIPYIRLPERGIHWQQRLSAESG